MRYLIFILTVITSIFANENIIKEGKELYLKANCQKCHLQDEKFDPNSIKKEGLKSKIKDKKGIHKWVVDCDSYFNIGWFPQEQDLVTEYLNRAYYKFSTQNNSKK
jgi:hypothetical protein